MESVKVYDMQSYIDATQPEGHNLEPFAFHEQLAIVVGPKGVLVWCDEGVGLVLNGVEATWGLQVVRREEGRFKMMHDMVVQVPIGDIIDKALSKEVPFATTIRSFGARLRQNFYEIWCALEKIGLDPTYYHPTGDQPQRSHR